MEKNFLETLEWRYACKAMNGEKVDAKIIEDILKAINLAPTSLGLQLFKVFVVENDAVKKQLRDAAFGQQPVEGCSHLFVFAAKKSVSDQDIKDYVHATTELRNYDEKQSKAVLDKLNSYIYDKMEKNKLNWSIAQTYIAMSFGLMAAAEAKVDSVPMEGFDKEKANEILSLKDTDYTVTLMMPIGYSDTKNDWMHGEPKVRKDLSEIVEFIK